MRSCVPAFVCGSDGQMCQVVGWSDVSDGQVVRWSNALQSSAITEATPNQNSKPCSTSSRAKDKNSSIRIGVSAINCTQFCMENTVQHSLAQHTPCLFPHAWIVCVCDSDPFATSRGARSLFLSQRRRGAGRPVGSDNGARV